MRRRSRLGALMIVAVSLALVVGPRSVLAQGWRYGTWQMYGCISTVWLNAPANEYCGASTWRWGEWRYGPGPNDVRGGVSSIYLDPPQGIWSGWSFSQYPDVTFLTTTGESFATYNDGDLLRAIDFTPAQITGRYFVMHGYGKPMGYRPFDFRLVGWAWPPDFPPPVVPPPMNAVPEPAVGLLFGLGLVALVARMTARRRAMRRSRFAP